MKAVGKPYRSGRGNEGYEGGGKGVRIGTGKGGGEG